MNFLKTLFWVLAAVLVALFANRNWDDVTLNLWGDIQLDIKIPLLLALVFLLGFLPTFVVQRAKIWSLHRRVAALEVHHAPPAPVAPEAAEEPSR